MKTLSPLSSHPWRQFVRCLILLEAAFTFFQGSVFAAEKPDRPNIIFILADDLGYTDLACYGSQYYETPNLDRLARQGIRFTDGHSGGPNCQPSRAALLSGQSMPRTGVYTVGSINRFNWQSRPLRPVENMTQLPLEKTTLAQALQKSGYATAMFGKWHLGSDAAHHPARRGFDEAMESSGRHFNFQTDPPTEYPKGTYLADFLTDKAVDFIRRHQKKPFFLYLPHYGVHSPYEAKPEIIEKFQKKAPAGGHHDPVYAAMIYSVDESVGRILALLDELKLAENTLVIFSSDNGGVGGYDREGIKKGKGITDNAPLRGGKGMLYEGGHRVPYIFRWPAQIPAGKTCATTITGVDLYPTLLAATQTPFPTNYPLDGESCLQLLTNGGQGILKRDAIYWHFPGYLGAGANAWRTKPVSVIRSGDWKLIEFLEDGRTELYNLPKDLSETNNLAAQNPAKAKELQAKLLAWRTEIKAPMPTPNTKETSAPAKSKDKKKKRQNRRTEN